MKNFIKKHKCKVCKRKYELTIDMLNHYSHKEGIFGTGYYTGFTCPYCNELYVYNDNLFPKFERPNVNGEFVKIKKEEQN